MKTWIFALAALTCGAAMAGETTATAKTEAKTVATFEALDKNADRQISRTEAGMDRALSNGFAFVDANGDGFVSAEEYASRSKS
jgi:hypothetical protein